jgi:hypothetical protein
MLDSRSLGAPLVDALETVGVLNDGRKITYALGLVVDKYRGMKDVSHGGATAGYQTFLARYPDQKVSVAVLCNGTSPSAGGLAAAITDEIFGPFPPPAEPQTSAAVVPEEHLKKLVGLWRNERSRFPGRSSLENGSLRFNGRPMIAVSEDTFMLGEARIKFHFDKDGKAVAFESNDSGEINRATHQIPWQPTAAELAQIAGDWRSEEAQSTLNITIEGDKAFVVIRPVVKLQLQPQYKDHLTAQGYVFWFTRDASGKIDKMHVGTGRMRNMLFERVGR